MDSLEFNKLAGGLLVGLLLAVGIGKLGDVLYAPDLPAHAAVEAGADAHADAGVGDHGEEPAVPLASLLAAADLADGESHFRKCKSCHAIAADDARGTGPNLYGIVGDAQARDAAFSYSGALSDLGGAWTFEALDAFLANPKEYARGTKMTFRGLSDAEDRANLIAWINTRSDAPLDLPAVEEPAAEDAMTEEELEARDAAIHGDTVDETIAAAEAAADGMAGGAGAMIAVASAEAGETVARKCKSCHTFEAGGANRVGPNLWDTVDRDIASIEGYRYSDAMESQEGAWTYDRLWSYLMDPRADIPGTKMGFRGVGDEEDLAALIAYLRTLSNDPAPLAGTR